MVGERAHQAKVHGLEKASAGSPSQTATPLTRQRGTTAIHQPQCIIGLLDRRMEGTSDIDWAVQGETNCQGSRKRR
jgi:hypothetical protein